jgi:nucleoside-diphosphate-sugar epimerase
MRCSILPLALTCVRSQNRVTPQVNGVDSLNATSRLFWNNATLQDDPVKGKGISLNFVDVRDNALAHAVALESPDAGGERFLVNASTFTWQDQSKSSSLPGTHS